MRQIIGFCFLVLASTLPAWSIDSGKAEYVGGTASLPAKTPGAFQLSGATEARFVYKGGELAIPYKKIESIEYGQKAGRRIGVAIMVSPIALLSKKRKHFVTIGYTDAAGTKQGVVIELGKEIVRSTLVTLETRSGRKIEYESEDAKKNIGN